MEAFSIPIVLLCVILAPLLATNWRGLKHDFPEDRPDAAEQPETAVQPPARPRRVRPRR